MNYSSYLLASWLCVILSYSGCLSQVTIAEDIKTLNDYFNTSRPEIADGASLFMGKMAHWKEDCDKKILMSHVIRVYFKIFEIFQNNTIIKKSLENIREDMIMKFFLNNTASTLNDFEEIINTQVNDLRVQKKAIFELSNVIHYISPKPHLKRRKRRQNKNQGEIKQ